MGIKNKSRMGINQFTKNISIQNKVLSRQRTLVLQSSGRVLPWHSRGPGINSQHCKYKQTNIHVPMLSLILFEETTLVLHL